MTADFDHEAWARLGRLLIARRVQLGKRNRLGWAREMGLSHDRTLSDIEKARRTNFDDATISFLEQAYRWGHGSIERVLAGGEPELLLVVTNSNDGSVLPPITAAPPAEDVGPEPYAARDQMLHDVPLDELLAEVARRARRENPDAQ